MIIRKAIKSTRHRQPFKSLFIHCFEVHSFSKRKDVLKMLCSFSLTDNFLYSSFANTFDRAQAKPNLLHLVDVKSSFTLIQVRAKHWNALPFTLAHEERDFINITLVVGKY